MSLIMSSKTIEQTYKKLTQREHVLQRPDTYIGSTKKHTEELWCFNENKMQKKILEYTPGFIKIFDEILTNATDAASRDPTVTIIKVDYNKTSGEISVYNNGKGIPVVIHAEHNVYIPDLVFSNLLTGSNYDDNEKRTGAGRNGLGSKATNIYSKSFIVETVDNENKKKFIQEHSNNMTIKSKPKVTSSSVKGYTKVTFVPDYIRFGMNGLDDDTISLINKRVIDCIALSLIHI